MKTRTREVMGYEVQTWTLQGNRIRKYTVIGNNTKTVVSQLQLANINYIQVCAMNFNFVGACSKHITIQTSDVVPGPVTKLFVYQLNASSLYVTWKRPGGSLSNVLEYNVNCAKINHSAPNNIFQVKDTNARINQLDTSVMYIINISAFNDVGAGGNATIKYHLHDDFYRERKHVNKPSFKYLMRNQTKHNFSIKITWIPNFMNSGKPGYCFFVNFKKKTDVVWSQTDIEYAGLTKIIYNLQYNEVYMVRVVSVSRVDNSLSEPIEIFEERQEYNGTLTMPTQQFIHVITVILYIILINLIIFYVMLVVKDRMQSIYQ